MQLNPQTFEYLRRSEGLNRWDAMPIQEARRAHRVWQIETATGHPDNATGRQSVRTEDISVVTSESSIHVRLYRPEKGVAGRQLPIVVFFHGGGFVIGDLDTHDELCREISSRVEALVVSVDYRLAPEHRFPAAVLDSVSATEWVIKNSSGLGGDASRVAVMGDSAGGNLAAVVALTLNGRKPDSIIFQLLIYPVTDNTGEVFETSSALEFGTGYELSNEALEWFLNQYFGDDMIIRRTPDASPVFASDLEVAPPALIIVAELDPIADSARQYAERLSEAGVGTKISFYPGVMHAFVTMGAFFDAAFEAMDESVETLRKAFY